MQKHLVIDVRAAQVKADGLTRYLQEHVPRLVAARRFRCTLLSSPAMRAYWETAAPAASISVLACRPMGMRQNWEVPRVLARVVPDLFFYPAHDPPVLLRTPFVCTVHDLTPHQVRPSFEHYDTVKTAYLRLVTRRALSRAKAVFVVSEATSAAIGELFGERAELKTVVTLNGASPVPATQPATGERRFLYVGTDRPHKNLLRMVEGFAHAAVRVPQLPGLDIVGGLRSERQLRESVERHGLQDRVRLRGHVSSEELEACYAKAIALVMPSLSEGFGIPILEAMQRGVPVITSTAPACAEVAGDAGLLVDPLSAESIGDAMIRMDAVPSLRHTLVERGRQRVRRFDWEQSSQVTLKTIERVLSTL